MILLRRVLLMFQSKIKFNSNKSFVFILSDDLVEVAYFRLFLSFMTMLFPNYSYVVLVPLSVIYLLDNCSEFVSVYDIATVDKIDFIQRDVNVVFSFSADKDVILFFNSFFDGKFISFSAAHVKEVKTYKSVYMSKKEIMFFSVFDWLGLTIEDVLFFYNHVHLKKESGTVLVKLLHSDGQQLIDSFGELKDKQFLFVNAHDYDKKEFWDHLDEVDCVLTDDVVFFQLALAKAIPSVGVTLELDREVLGAPYLLTDSTHHKDLQECIFNLLYKEFDQSFLLAFQRVLKQDKRSLLYVGNTMLDFLKQHNVECLQYRSLFDFWCKLISLDTVKYSSIIFTTEEGTFLNKLTNRFLQLLLKRLCFFKQINVYHVQSEFDFRYKLSL